MKVIFEIYTRNIGNYYHETKAEAVFELLEKLDMLPGGVDLLFPFGLDLVGLPVVSCQSVDLTFHKN